MYPGVYGYSGRTGCARLSDQGIHWATKQKTAPAIEPVTLDEAKTHIRVDVDDDDALITGKIRTARIHAEQFLGRKVVQQTWNLYLDRFPSWLIDLRETGLMSLVSVTSITYIDSGGTTQTLSSSLYKVDTAAHRITPAYGQSWPSTRSEMNAVNLEIVCGYGTTTQAVPQSVRDGIFLRIGTLYMYREEKTFDRGSLAELDSAESCWSSEQNAYVMVG